MPELDRLEIVPLGGLGEFGMNLMVYRLGTARLVVDAGMMFPGAEHLGVDVVIPDMAYLDDGPAPLAVVLTHGHEDHIGAVPWLLGRFDVPVFGTPYTLALVRRRLREHGLDGSAALRRLPDDGSIVQIGPFGVEAVPVAHSIPHSCLLVLRTPVGVIVHTADFKLDPAPPDGRALDLERLAQVGREGVLAVLSDSTNAETPGTTAGEATVRPALDRVFARTRGRVVCTTFSSHVSRIQQIVDVAAAHGRRIAVVGSSMRAHVDIAEELGLLRFPSAMRLDPEAVADTPPSLVAVLATGAQGEPAAALPRIALDRHREVRLTAGDVVVHSARTIPGNERSVARMFDHVLRRGAEIMTASDDAIHVSGHASSDELRALIRLLRPDVLIPSHGEYRQLLAHARIAREMGVPNVPVVESGDVLAVDGRTCEVVERVPVGQVFIDATLEEVDRFTLRDRRRLAEDGTVVAVVAVDRETGALRRPPDLVTRGFVSEADEDGLLRDAVRELESGIREASSEERADEGILKDRIHANLRRFFRRRTQRRPMIIPVIVEF